MKTVNLPATGPLESPLSPFNRHLLASGSSVTRLVGFFDAALAGDWHRARRLQEEIRAIEDRSRQLKRRLRRSISRHFKLAETCQRLDDLLAMQGNVAFHARLVVVIMYTRRVAFPPTAHQQVFSLVKSIVMMTETILEAIDLFDRRLALPQDERNLSPFDLLPGDLDRLERDCRRLSMSVRTRLYRSQSKIEPINLLLSLYVIELLGDLVSRSRKMGNCLQLLLKPAAYAL